VLFLVVAWKESFRNGLSQAKFLGRDRTPSERVAPLILKGTAVRGENQLLELTINLRLVLSTNQRDGSEWPILTGLLPEGHFFRARHNSLNAAKPSTTHD
jgi:hypothetical protein